MKLRGVGIRRIDMLVAPRRGAWIETIDANNGNFETMSRPAGARGLKQLDRV